MKTVKGFNDFSGEEALKRERIKRIVVETFKAYGFEPAETPVIEYEEFVKSGNLGQEAISDIFKLHDKGKRELALRYELTFQLKRLAKNKKLPYKRYQIGEVFRDEPVSKNRFKQFMQCDADIIGCAIKDEAEIIAMANDILKKLGIAATIFMNNRKLLNEILEKEGIKDKNSVIREIDKLDKLPEKNVRENLKKYNAERLTALFKKPEAYFRKYSAYREIVELKEYCSYYGIKMKFKPNLARGLPYYSGNIFEIKSQKMKETLIGGGAYLVNGLQSVGISFGLERLSSLVKIDVEEKRVLVISIGKDKEAIEISKDLRENGVDVVLMFGKISKALDYANSLKLPYVIFIGKKEVARKKLKLRNMKTGKEDMLNMNKLIKKLEF